MERAGVAVAAFVERRARPEGPAVLGAGLLLKDALAVRAAVAAADRRIADTVIGADLVAAAVGARRTRLVLLREKKRSNGLSYHYTQYTYIYIYIYIYIYCHMLCLCFGIVIFIIVYIVKQHNSKRNEKIVFFQFLRRSITIIVNK